MKKILCILLAALLLTGCQAGTQATAPGITEPPVIATDPIQTTVPETTAPATEPVEEPAAEIPFTDPGKARISYEGTRSFVRYITSPEELPELEALQGFDSAFFADHALLLIVETVNSGSVQLEIDTILGNSREATVTLKRSMSGEVGTSDMATWLLWAVVDKGYDCTWNLETDNVLHNVTKF